MRCSEVDFFKVFRVVSNDSVWPWIHDDKSRYCLDPETLTKKMLYTKDVLVLMPDDDCVLLGFPRSGILLDVHACVHPSGRGAQAVKSTRAAISWVFENTDFRAMISFVPVIYKHAAVFSIQVGMTERGILPKSFQFNGVVYDQHIFSIERS